MSEGAANKYTNVDGKRENGENYQLGTPKLSTAPIKGFGESGSADGLCPHSTGYTKIINSSKEFGENGFADGGS